MGTKINTHFLITDEGIPSGPGEKESLSLDIAIATTSSSIATSKEGMIFEGVWVRPSDKDKGQVVGSTNMLAMCLANKLHWSSGELADSPSKESRERIVLGFTLGLQYRQKALGCIEKRSWSLIKKAL